MTKNVSFQTAPKKLAALDRLAKARDCDRSEVINDAIDTYLDVQDWQTEYIEDAVTLADAGGSFVAHADVVTWAKSLNRGTGAPDPEPTIKPRRKNRQKSA